MFRNRHTGRRDDQSGQSRDIRGAQPIATCATRIEENGLPLQSREWVSLPSSVEHGSCRPNQLVFGETLRRPRFEEAFDLLILNFADFDQEERFDNFLSIFLRKVAFLFQPLDELLERHSTC